MEISPFGHVVFLLTPYKNFNKIKNIFCGGGVGGGGITCELSAKQSGNSHEMPSLIFSEK